MFDISTKIATACTIFAMLSFAGYIYSTAKQTSKYHILIFYFKPSAFSWMWKNDKINSISFLIVPVILSICVVLISQFHDGIYKIRADFQILLGAALWVLMLFLHKYLYDLICKLKDIIKKNNDE